MNKISIAIVVPRYLESIGGGAETLIKSYVDNIFLPREDLFKNIDVITTCVKDHRTWKNELEAGMEKKGRLTIRRFPVEELNIEKFAFYENEISKGVALSLDEQFQWLKSGVNSKSLYSFLNQNKKNYDLILIGPYLFPISFWSAMISPENTVLIPCLHDERYAYLDCFRELFLKVKSVFYNSLPEKELAKKIYSISNKGYEVGMGFVKAESNTTSNSVPYILYSGRKETGKGLDLLIDYYSKLPEEFRKNKLKLHLIGSGEINFLESLPIGVKDLGFVSEQEKHDCMANCLALVQPSINESFSIVLMETWLQARPVIVRESCDVTKRHVLDSSGGLYFQDFESFKKSLEFLLESESSSNMLGENGRDFVQKKYNWKSVESRMIDSLKKENILA